VTAGDDVLELLLGKLDGVTQHGAYWTARCPGHDDNKASLSVSRGTKQPVILKCHANCHRDAILAAIGLTVADISRPGNRRAEWTPWAGDCPCQPVARYPYKNETGNLLFEVVRGEHKEFAQRRPDPSSRSGWRWKIAGVRRVPYRLPDVIEAVAAGEYIYVAEGEKDVHALEAAGVTATCNPGGAGKWLPEFAGFLRGAIVTIIADKDEQGLSHARQVAASLDGIAQAVEIVEAAEGKDAADHLAAGLTVGDFVRLPPETDASDSSESRLSENPDPLTSDNGGSDTSDSGVKYELRDGPWLDAQQFPPLQYNVPGLMPAGLGIIAAPPKAGKSLLILDWLLAIASGGYALGSLPTGHARDVLYLALEDGDRRLQARCRQLLPDGQAIPERFRYVLAVPPGQVLAVLNHALAKYPDTALLVVDTLGRIMPLPQQGETTYQRDYRVAVALKKLADQRPGLSIIVIHHTRKAFSDDFIDSISGTHGLAGAADTIITLSRGRGQGDGILRVTGRDVIESDYAVAFSDGAWRLDGDNLADARANVSRRAETGHLGERSAEIIDFVRQQPEGAQAKQVREKFGKDADTYLKRLSDSGRLTRPRRGLYVVSEPSESSEPQVNGLEKSDSATLPLSEPSEPGPGAAPGDQDGYLARRAPAAPSPQPPCEHEACYDAMLGRCLVGETVCKGCLQPMDAALVAAGIRAHANCEAT
jgi:hypothetical protein